MNKSYILGENKKVFEIEEFPHINDNEKVIILFTGGIKSTLLALIAKELYGLDRVIFGHHMVEIDDSKAFIHKKKFDEAVLKLGGKHKFVLSKDDYDPYSSTYKNHNTKLLKAFPNTKFCLAGYTAVDEESMLAIKDSGWVQGKITNGQLVDYILKNPEKYKSLNNSHYKISFINQTLGFEQLEEHYYSMVRPFRFLEDHEVMLLYKKLGFTNELQQTSSCKFSDNHCGECGNCSNRINAFRNAGIKDTTTYTFI